MVKYFNLRKDFSQYEVERTEYATCLMVLKILSSIVHLCVLLRFIKQCTDFFLS